MRTLDEATLLAYANIAARQNMDKEPADAACWNWALYGLKPLPVAQPSLLFGYVNRGATRQQQREEAEGQVDRAPESGLGAARAARVHARYVTALHDSQAGWLELLATGVGS